MTLSNKKTIFSLCLVLLALQPILHFGVGFLCTEGFIGGTIFYSVMMLILILSAFMTNRKARDILNLLLVVLPVFYAFITPLGMLNQCKLHGGIDFFLTERLTQYICLQSTLLLLLILISRNYVKEKNLDSGTFAKNWISPLSIVLLIRVFWMVFFESRHIHYFAMNLPELRVEYVVLMSIPLFLSILVLTLRKILAGYILGILAGLGHVVLTVLIVIMGTNPAIIGPVIVILSSLAIMFFSFRGIMYYHFDNNKEVPAFGKFVMKNILTIRRRIENHKKILQDAGISEGMKVLDYGCGIGNYSLQASGIIGTSGSIIAADINKTMIGGLDKDIKLRGIDNVKTQLIRKPEEIKEGDFDFVLLIDVIHLIEHKLEMIQSLLKKLTNGGKMLLKLEHIKQNVSDGIFKKLSELGYKYNHLFKDYWIIGRS
jgi:precorrin-6B methylase 2